MIPLSERLSTKMKPQGECLVFTGHRNWKGYGEIRSGPDNGFRKLMAHRAAWELNSGPIPEGLVVMHTCDNPPCCNPSHLRLGTVADNQADMKKKGRHLNGAKVGKPVQRDSSNGRYASK